MLRYVALALAIALLPLFAQAAGTPSPSVGETSALECPVDAFAPTTEPAEPPELALENPEPIALACEYRCPFCPAFRDRPPATCDNSGCCSYENQCVKKCAFDIDCGGMSSCWSGCCMDWNPPPDPP